MRREDYLFCEGDLDATLKGHLDSLSERVDAISQDQFMNAQPDEIAGHIVADMTVEPLVLYEKRAELEQHETKIDVSGYRDRNIFGDRGPIYVAGIAVAVSIPFTGDGSLWKLKPSHWQSIFPRGRIESGRGQEAGRLIIDLSQPADEPSERFKQRLDEQMKSIRFYV